MWIVIIRRKHTGAEPLSSFCFHLSVVLISLTLGMDMNSFCKGIPKLELHAHLYGSIRATTLIELASERNVILPSEFLLHEEKKTTTTSKVG
jgi:hypothetical protein